MADKVGCWVFITLFSIDFCMFLTFCNKTNSLHSHTIMSVSLLLLLLQKSFYYDHRCCGSKIQTRHSKDVLSRRHDVWDLSMEDWKAGAAPVCGAGIPRTYLSSHVCGLGFCRAWCSQVSQTPDVVAQGSKSVCLKRSTQKLHGFFKPSLSFVESLNMVSTWCQLVQPRFKEKGHRSLLSCLGDCQKIWKYANQQSPLSGQ